MKQRKLVVIVLAVILIYFVWNSAKSMGLFSDNTQRSSASELAIVSVGLSTQQATAVTQDLFVLDRANATTHIALTVIPIKATTLFMAMHAGLGPYLTLKQAMDKGVVAITEKVGGSANSNNNISDNATVNTLYIENTGIDTVFVMAGELVQGGKQDRVIAKSFLLFPKSGTTDLSVFCVEHGRWDYGSASGMANADVVKFSVKEMSVANSVRKTAVKEKQQSKVWEQVAYVTEENKSESSTGTYNALDSNQEFVDKTEEYEKYFSQLFGQPADVIGVAVFSGSTFIGIDVFCNNALFRHEWNTLLHAYITDVVTDPGKENTPNESFVNTTFAAFEKVYADNSEKTADQKCIHKNKVVHCTHFSE